MRRILRAILKNGVQRISNPASIVAIQKDLKIAIIVLRQRDRDSIIDATNDHQRVILRLYILELDSD